MTDDYRTRNVLRNMAWERAKGELLSMLSTFWAETEEYERFKKAIEEFIEKMNDEVLN